MVHGYREILHGNTPTGGMLLVSVGAFTLIPNYLATGIATILVSLGVIVWTVGFLGSRKGPLVLLALVIALFLVGGGFAHVIAFALVTVRGLASVFRSRHRDMAVRLRAGDG